MIHAEAATRESLAELLCALSFATDIGMGHELEHGLKSAYIALQIADRLGLKEPDREAVFYGSLLKDVGCTAGAPAFATFFAGDDLDARRDAVTLDPGSMRDAIAWFRRHAPRDVSLPGRIAGLLTFVNECRPVLKESVTAQCEVGELFARRLGMPEGVQQAVRYAWERWDGRGFAFGRKGEAIPIAARVVHFAQVVQVANQFGGRSAAEVIAKERRGTDFDPAVTAAFLELSARRGFRGPLDQQDAQQTILAMRPRTSSDALDATTLDAACEVIADFADAKSPVTRGHSRLVAETAAAIALAMGLGVSARERVRRAALVHDIGVVAVPVGIIDKRDALTDREATRYRQHPSDTQRILARVRPLADLADDAAAHHEWVNGTGYHRQLSGDALSVPARILAVADAYARVARDANDHGASERALSEIRGFAGERFDPACVAALATALDWPVVPDDAPRDPDAGPLTKREIEVLRVVAEGASNRAVARRLVIDEKTVDEHMEHILGKLEVSSRTAAVMTAVHQGLLE